MYTQEGQIGVEQHKQAKRCADSEMQAYHSGVYWKSSRGPSGDKHQEILFSHLCVPRPK